MKKQFLAVVATLLLATLGLTSQLSAQNKFEHGDFATFMFASNNKSKSYAVEKNPDGTDELVESFYIDGTKCRADDCKHGSVRSQLKTNISDDKRSRSITSPKKAWYSFEIYLPKEFSYGTSQVRGNYIFTEFKESNPCPGLFFSSRNQNIDTSLYLIIGEATGKIDTKLPGKPASCSQDYKAKVNDISAMLGKWTRFEFFVNWSEGEDGYVEVYSDNVKVLEHSGKNCKVLSQCLERNQFYYGIYKPNNADLKSVSPAKVYYRNVSMAQKREELLR